MNSNLFRTIAAVLTAGIGILMSVGHCAVDAVSAATVCTADWLTTTTAGYLVAGLGIAHVVLKLIGGGVSALIKPTTTK